MLRSLPNWFTSVFNGFKVLYSDTDVSGIVEGAVSEYSVHEGKVWVQQHFPEEGTPLEFKRAVLKHFWGNGTLAVATMFSPQVQYGVGGIVSVGTITYEIIQEIAEVVPPGDGHEAGAQAGDTPRSS